MRPGLVARPLDRPRLERVRVLRHALPGVTGMLPYNVVDHVARARCNGAEGWGMFEHANMGRHDPSGFTDWIDMAE
ncbi:hypothetical protein GCM10022294_28820 [Dietzia aurantiaca]